MTDNLQPAHPLENKPEPHLQIQIDRVHYSVTKSTMEGRELRNVPNPPLGSDRDLFEVLPGQPDRKVGDADVVRIHDGQRFFTAPSLINPGCCH